MLKIGTKVKIVINQTIIETARREKYFNDAGVFLNPEMIRFNGRISIIEAKVDGFVETFRLRDVPWIWSDEWLVLQKRIDKLKRILDK